jgi:hypothetical protein
MPIGLLISIPLACFAWEWWLFDLLPFCCGESGSSAGEIFEGLWASKNMTTSSGENLPENFQLPWKLYI